MAVPKRRVSKARQGKRRSHQHLKARQNTYCVRCGEAMQAAYRLLELRLAQHPGPRSRRHRGSRGELSHANRTRCDGGRSCARARSSQARSRRCRKTPRCSVVLVGDQAQIEPLLAAAASVRDRLEVFHCTQVITMEESPASAFRKKPDNSISRCWQLLAEHKVEAIVSAGNTGAMVAGGFLLRLFLKGVRRPGIAAADADAARACRVLLDVGANVIPKPEHLYQYGVMGAIFAKHILQRDKPKIGLMNVGSEEDKGHDLAKETHALFQQQPAQGPVHRQHRRPRHQQGRLRCRSSPTASSATSS